MSGGKLGLGGVLLLAGVAGIAMVAIGDHWVDIAGRILLGVVAGGALVWLLVTVVDALVGDFGWMKLCLAVLAIAYGALAVYAIYGVVTPDDIPNDVCAANQNPARKTQRPAARRVTLTVTGNDATTPNSNLTVALGQARRIVTRRQMLAVQAPTVPDGARTPGLHTGAHLQIVATDFIRSADGSELPAASIVANAVVVGNDRVEVSVCFNPQLEVEQTVSPPTTAGTTGDDDTAEVPAATVAPTTSPTTSTVLLGAGTAGPTSSETTTTTSTTTTTTQPLQTRDRIAAPGRYSGRVVIVDDRVQRLELPVDITMQYSEWPLMLTLFLGILPFAAFVVFAGQGQSASLRRETFGRFGRWMRDNPVPIGSGVAAALTAFFARYLRDPAWSGEATEFLALIATVGGAFVTALTIVATGRKLALPAETDDGAPEPGPDPAPAPAPAEDGPPPPG